MLDVAAEIRDFARYTYTYDGNQQGQWVYIASLKKKIVKNLERSPRAEII